MTIGVKGQYKFKFSLGGQSDFFDPQGLEYFTMIEECGNILPSWEISFATENEDILKYVNEGNDLEVSYGNDDNMIDTKLLICKKDINKLGSRMYQIQCKGIYSCIEYITVPHIFISDKTKASEVIKKKAEKYFSIDKVDDDDNEQNWIQHSMTDKGFVNHLALHAYKEGSFFGTGITSDGKFRFVDINKLASGDYKWKFGGDGGIKITGDTQFISNAGFLNSWMGYGREQLVQTLEKGGPSTKTSENVEAKLTLSSKLERTSDVSKRYAVLGLHNDNCHDKYHNAKLKNIQGLTSYSAEQVELCFMGDFKDIKIFDVAMLKDPSQEKSEASGESYSGLYIVGLVSRSLSKKQFNTVVHLFREGTNSSSGSFK